LSGFDSDTNYDTRNDEDYHTRTPVQPPINPPYKQAIELKHGAAKSITDTAADV